MTGALLALLSIAAAASAWWSDARPVSAGAILVCWLAFTAAIVVRHRRGHARPRQAGTGNVGGNGSGRGHANQAGGKDTIWVVYASQAGFAEQLASRTAASLRDAGVDARLLCCTALDRAMLADARRVLFVVSTTGEGDAPDSAAGLLRTLSGAARGEGLPRLRYGILALGDRNYARFCAFGHALSAWLRQARARPLFDLVEVDNGDAGALRRWQHHLAALAGGGEIAEWERPRHGDWILRERRLLNAGSPGAPAFHLALEPAGAAPLDWAAGDIAEIGPQHAPVEVAAWLERAGLDGAAQVRCDGTVQPLAEALATRLLLPPAQIGAMQGVAAQALVDALSPLPRREYSIASLPADGRLELLVRQARRADGSLGLASAWLTVHATTGATIALRVRPNRAFHAPDSNCPLILIGSGTGLAGLRAHLKARVAAGRRRNWLLFGERSAATDGFYAEELARWRASGMIERLDLTWSRDRGAWRYVQDAVAGRAGAIREWVEAGAAIYVCGSRAGMAAGVEAVLADILGAQALAALRESGRYRRDVY